MALLTPSNIYNVFLEPQSNDLWSPLQFGFGLDKSLHSLLAAIRPNEYPKSFFEEEQSNNILDIDNSEWDRTKSIFSVGALFRKDVDYYAEGDWGTNLASTQQAILEADSDNDQNYLSDYDTSGDILAMNDRDETHSPRMHYEGREVISIISSASANFIDTFQTEDLMMNGKY